MVTEVRLGKKTLSVWSIVAAVGGVMAVIALFMQWVAVSGYIGVTETYYLSGLDLLNGKFNGMSVDYSFASKIPLIVMILGILAIICSFLPTFIGKDRIMAFTLTILSFAMLILCIVFLAMGLKSSLFSGNWETYAKTAELTYSIGAGTVLALIGGILCITGGALNIKENM